MKPAIYLDYNATAPLDPVVLEAMMPYLTENFGNSLSIHDIGKAAAKGQEWARAEVAALINCQTSEVIFTSGGTESNNAAIRSVARTRRAQGNHIITTAVEHASIIKNCQELMTDGYQVSFLPVDSEGCIELAALQNAITERTILISVMHANNEVGSIQPIAKIGEIARKHNIYFHCDAAQSVSKLDIDFQKMHIDLLTMAAHKFYGPKGIGALIVREGVEFHSWMLGAGHEEGRRAGTANVPSIVGFGKACEIARTKGGETAKEVQRLRDLFHNIVTEALPDVKLNGHREHRLPNTLNLSFRGCDGQQLLAETNIAASLGAACHTSSRQPSAVLTAMGVDAETAVGAVRFSFGKFTDEAAVREAAARIIEAVKRARN